MSRGNFYFSIEVQKNQFSVAIGLGVVKESFLKVCIVGCIVGCRWGHEMSWHVESENRVLTPQRSEVALRANNLIWETPVGRVSQH